MYKRPRRNSVQIKRHLQTESKKMEKAISCKRKTFKSCSNYIYINKLGFKTKAVIETKKKFFSSFYIKFLIMIKEIIQQEDRALINIYGTSTGAPKCIKEILTDIEGDVNSNTIIVVYFNSLWTSMN